MERTNNSASRPSLLLPAHPRVLLVRFSSIGDVLLTTPVIRAVRRRWPGAALSFLTREKFAPVLEGNPHLDELIILRDGAGYRDLLELGNTLNRKPWHLVADLHTSLRSRKICGMVRSGHKVAYKKFRFLRGLLIHARLDLYGPSPPSVPERYAACLAPFGVELDNGPCELALDERDRLGVLERINGRFGPGGEILAVAPGAAWPVKRWPAGFFAAVAGRLAAERDLGVVLLGGKGDRRECDAVENLLDPGRCLNLCGEPGLRQSAAAVERSALLLTNDTGLMHIATAVGTPVAAVFGPTTRHFGYFPYRAKAVVVENVGLWCRPCTHNGRGRCPLGHFRCMRDIGPERVYRAALELLG